MSYEKPWQGVAEQLSTLQARGLLVSDSNKALSYLQRIGYYRLSGYWFAFRERSGLCCALEAFAHAGAKPKTQTLVLDAFKHGATFQNAVDLYVFDKQLRLLVGDALERIEVALRVDASHTMGQLDPFAYLKGDFFTVRSVRCWTRAVV